MMMFHRIGYEIGRAEEQWKREHDHAMQCRDVEVALKQCVEVFNSICKADETIQDEIFSGKRDYCEHAHQELLGLYKLWADTFKEVEKGIQPLVESFDHIEGLDEFRNCFREAVGILTDDAEFFVHDKLAELGDSAIDEHRQNV